MRTAQDVLSLNTTAMPGKGARLADRASVSGDAGTFPRTFRDTAAS
jgi:hypothetical protein